MTRENSLDRTSPLIDTPLSRRGFVRSAGALGALAGIESLLPGYAWGDTGAPGMQALQPRMEGGLGVYDLTIAETPIRIGRRSGQAITINGTVPGPLLHLYEGQEALLRVTNRLREDTSIHWHGLILPPEMDGVPGVSFPGIRPGETFEYRIPVQQYGTYWYHSHSGLQEQVGHYGPMVIHPAGGYPYQFDREYTIVLSDWTFQNPYRILANLKKQGNYYNRQRLTLVDLFEESREIGLMAAIRQRLMWDEMRMDPTDLLDVTGAVYTYLMNGLAPETNWTGLFQPGERVLLHIVNAAAMSYFDVRIPGLPMTVVQVSGQHVQPVETDEFRIAVAETYDVIVQPTDDRPYTIFAEVTDRSGYARGTLATRQGMKGEIPPRRKRPVLTMADMGMSHGDMGGMDMGGGGGTGGMNHGAAAGAGAGGMAGMDHGNMPGMQMPAAGATAGGAMPGHEGMPGMGAAGGDQARFAIAGMIRTEGLRPPGTLPGMLEHEPDTHGPGNSAVPMMAQSRLHEPGVGLGEDGWRVLTYTQLRAMEPREDFRAPDREIEIHLTGNMERFLWSINGVAFEDSEPIRFNYGERLRLTMVNDSMMPHPMHLHGMWMELENGQGEYIPRVHTVNVKPAERLSLLITADAPGAWAFHCHMLFHMEVGMFRVVEVLRPGETSVPPQGGLKQSSKNGMGHE